MNFELNQKVAKSLKNSESILWCGQPRVRVFTLIDLILIPFACIWTSMPLRESIRGWSEFAMHRNDTNLFMLLWMSMFAVIGLYLIIGRAIHEYFRRKTRYFIVTNERIISLSKMWPSTLQSRDLSGLTNLSIIRDNKNAKAGSIFFEQRANNDQGQISASFAPLPYNLMKVPVFYDLPDLDAPLVAIKQQCPEDKLVISDMNALSAIKLFTQLSKTESTDLQKLKMQNPDYGQDLIETDKVKSGITYINSPGQEELNSAHRRMYVARSIGMLAGVICALIFGLSALSSAAERNQLLLQSKSWSMSSGKIEKLEIGSSKGTPYLKNFKVGFSIDGKNYFCEKYSFAGFYTDSRSAQYKFAKMHKIGDAVDVYYDAKDPTRNVLERSAEPSNSQENTGKVFIGLGLLLLAIVILRLFISKLRTFEAKPLKIQSMAVVIFQAAFMSIWFCMFFGLISTTILYAVLRAR